MRVRIAEFRLKQKWSQEELAERAGVSVAAIRKYEQDKGGFSALATLERLGSALGVDPIVLISEEHERLLAERSHGVDETTLAEAIALVIATAGENRLQLTPEQIAKAATLFYQASFQRRSVEEPTRD